MFIWTKEIKSVNHWLVEYKDWTQEEFSEWYAEYFTSKEAKELDDFNLYKTHKIIWDIMKILVETNSSLSEIEQVYKWLVSSIDNAKDEAIARLFSVSHPSHISFKTINDIVVKK